MSHDSIYRVCIKALIRNDEGVLLAREPSGVWDLLGGGIEELESPEACLEREIFEETGLKVADISSNPVHFYTSASNRGNPVANIVYEVELESGELMPSGECEELRFMNFAESNKVALSPSAKKLFELLI